MTDFREIAETLFNEGFNIIPLNEDKTPKHILTGTNYLYEVQSIFDDRYICERIGVTCGIASSGLEVVDFDKHQGQNIQEIFESFVSDQNIINMISSGKIGIYSTPSGGFHLMYKCSDRFIKSSEVLSRYPEDEIMIELRAGGSYVVCWPSSGYIFQGGTEFMKLEPIDRDEREYILTLAKTYNKGKVSTHKTGTSQDWGKWDETKPWGKYNIEGREEARESLMKAGWSYITTRTLDDVELWRRPGKVKGTSGTFGKYHNMFYCFSSSALPFEPNTGYSPTDILMITKFGGDWQRTREYLELRYRPERPELVSDTISFPLEVFPESVQDMIKEFNSALNYKQDFLAVAFMFSVATLNGNKYKLRVKNGWTAATTFWFAVVGETGVMKTHPVNQMIQPLKSIDKKMKYEYDTQVEIFDSMDEKTKKQNKKPNYRQIMISDATLEALHYVHNINPRGLGYHKDELAGFFNDMNKYRKGSDEQFWLESFNNGTWIVNRVSKEPMSIDNIMINLIGGIQPSVLSTFIGSANGNGIIERFLFTSSESNIYPINSDDINIEWINWYNKSIENCDVFFQYFKPEDSVILEMDKDAFNKFIEADTWICSLQESADETPGLKNYLNKIKTYMPRLALLILLIDVIFKGEVLKVNLSCMERAFVLAKYFINSARSIFDTVENNNEIEMARRPMNQKGMTKIEQILELYKKGFKQSDIAKKLETPKSYVSKVIGEKQAK